MREPNFPEFGKKHPANPQNQLVFPIAELRWLSTSDPRVGHMSSGKMNPTPRLHHLQNEQVVP